MTRIWRTTAVHWIGLVLAVLLGLVFWIAQPSAAESVRVKYINDGDTVQLVDGRPVRYIGVNAPEIEHARQTAQPFGFEARALNAELEQLNAEARALETVIGKNIRLIAGDE